MTGLRPDREDYTEQEEAVRTAANVWSRECEALAREAKAARKSPGIPASLHMAWRAVLAAEEALDMARHDLATARGEDA